MCESKRILFQKLGLSLRRFCVAVDEPLLVIWRRRAVERMARMERESHHMMTPNVLWSAPEEELLRTIQQVR
jgi:hypothetical protein